MAIIASLVSAPTVMVIPRARTSPTFDRLLWAATVLVGFLAAWIGVAISTSQNLLNTPAVGDTPVPPVIIGALLGALVVNVPLWLLDRFEAGAEENGATAAGEQDRPERS